MVKFDEDDGALNTIVERVVVAKPANPAKVRLVQKTTDLLQTTLPRRLGEIEKILLQDSHDEGDLVGRHL